MFKRESDVRKWMKRHLGRERLFWHEASAGGTIGFPDCEMAIGGHPNISTMVPIEVKCGPMVLHQGKIMHEPLLRPSQMEVARRFEELGVFGIYLVGELGGDTVAVGRLDLAELAQRNGQHAQLEPWAGVDGWGLVVEGLARSYFEHQERKTKA